MTSRVVKTAVLRGSVKGHVRFIIGILYQVTKKVFFSVFASRSLAVIAGNAGQSRFPVIGINTAIPVLRKSVTSKFPRREKSSSQ
jgi:hypothetical protein